MGTEGAAHTTGKLRAAPPIFFQEMAFQWRRYVPSCTTPDLAKQCCIVQRWVR